MRPWICSTGVLRPFCVRGKGGGCHADTLPAGDRGRGAPAFGPVVGRTHSELTAALSRSHRPPAPHAGWPARAALPGGRLRPRRPRRQRLPRLPRLQHLPPLPTAAPGPARHLRPPVPERPASTCCAPAPPAAPRPLLRQRKGEWTPAADLLMMTNDDTR